MCEAETVLQPSLHTIPEYVGMVLDEAESRGVDVADLRGEYNRNLTSDQEFIGEIADECLSRLWDAGYANLEENDILTIMPKGVDAPAGWNDGP